MFQEGVLADPPGVAEAALEGDVSGILFDVCVPKEFGRAAIVAGQRGPGLGVDSGRRRRRGHGGLLAGGQSEVAEELPLKRE